MKTHRVTKPVGNLVRPQLTELELLSYMKDGNRLRLRSVVTLEQLGT
jgi:hypothetical protein